MEEKERYEFIDFEDGIELIDTENKKALDDADKIKDTLNQQSKRIKELEEENKKANINNYLEDYFLVEKENQQLKQQLHDLPKKIVEEIREKVIGLWYFVLEEQKEYFEGNRYVLSKKDFNKILTTILKKYGGEHESNND